MRINKDIERTEYRNFLNHLQVDQSLLDSVNLFDQPNWDAAQLKGYSGFLIGGLSDDPADSIELEEEHYPFLHAFDQILQTAIKFQIPGLLSCGGFMIATVLLGGEIALNKDLEEMDIVDVNLQSEVTDDPLLEHTPTQLGMVSCHLKSTTRLPDGCTLLGSSDRCQNHIFKIDGSPIYAFQGHPEITTEELKERVIPYKTKYFDNDADYECFIGKNADTTSANRILKSFTNLALAQ